MRTHRINYTLADGTTASVFTTDSPDECERRARRARPFDRVIRARGNVLVIYDTEVVDRLIADLVLPVWA